MSVNPFTFGSLSILPPEIRLQVYCSVFSEIYIIPGSAPCGLLFASKALRQEATEVLYAEGTFRFTAPLTTKETLGPSQKVIDRMRNVELQLDMSGRNQRLETWQVGRALDGFYQEVISKLVRSGIKRKICRINFLGCELNYPFLHRWEFFKHFKLLNNFEIIVVKSLQGKSSFDQRIWGPRSWARASQPHDDVRLEKQRRVFENLVTNIALVLRTTLGPSELHDGGNELSLTFRPPRGVLQQNSCAPDALSELLRVAHLRVAHPPSAHNQSAGLDVTGPGLFSSEGKEIIGKGCKAE